MKKYAENCKRIFSDHNNLRLTLESFALIILSLIANAVASEYATEKASNFVTDIILSNIRVYDVDWIFNYGAIVFWIFIIFLCIKKPARIAFVLKSTALFILIRSVFISITHLGAFPTQIYIDPTSFVSNFTFGGDLFFSGHTGLPFLMSYIFWKDIRLRILFMALSIIFGVSVLMGHLHYSIDVLAAFFITYTIYHMALYLFREDKKLFDSIGCKI
ncbi:MAG: hypothetical protein HZA95_00830 [Candidatus Vogelbacteria bacterium]|nr:hypothetical protein [Candidatus Vogelbacteria bacterium]